MAEKEMLFRCSAVGNLMSEPKLVADKKAGKLSKTAESYLNQFIFEYKYGRRQNFSTKATRKGTQTEKEGIKVLNAVHKLQYKKNDERFNGEYLTGEPDIIGKDIIIDIKSNFLASTFLTKDSIDNLYFWQLLGYCVLTNKRKGAVAYTLNNTPLDIIKSELISTYFKNGLIDLTDEDKAKIALNHIYTDKHFVDGKYVNGFWDYAKDYLGIFEDVQVPFIEVPIEKRLRYFEVEFTDEDFEKLDTQIEKAIKYIETNYPLI